MPKVPNQNMFALEECNDCQATGELYVTLRGRYIWRCPICTGTWRTPDSQLELINSIIGPINFDIPAGVIITEKKMALTKNEAIESAIESIDIEISESYEGSELECCRGWIEKKQEVMRVLETLKGSE